LRWFLGKAIQKMKRSVNNDVLVSLEMLHVDSFFASLRRVNTPHIRLLLEQTEGATRERLVAMKDMFVQEGHMVRSTLDSRCIGPEGRRITMKCRVLTLEASKDATKRAGWDTSAKSWKDFVGRGLHTHVIVPEWDSHMAGATTHSASFGQLVSLQTLEATIFQPHRRRAELQPAGPVAS